MLVYFLGITSPTSLNASFSATDRSVNVSFDVPENTKQYDNIYTGLSLIIVADGNRSYHTLPEYPKNRIFSVNLRSVTDGVHTFELKLKYKQYRSAKFVREVSRGDVLFENLFIYLNNRKIIDSVFN